MIPDSFKEKVLGLCDRWYGKNGRDGWEVWEKPYKRGPGFMTDYKVAIIPYDPTVGAPFHERLNNLKYALKVRNEDRQSEEVKGMIQRNEEKKEKERKAYVSATSAWAKEARSTFAKLGDEIGSGRSALRKQFGHLNDAEFHKEIMKIQEEGERLKYDSQ